MQLRFVQVGLTLVAALALGCGSGVASHSAPTGNSTPAAAPTGGATPSAEAVAPEATPGVVRTPGPSVPHVPPLKPPAFASRIVVSDLNIDLPVISGDLQPPPSYPLCDVAAYVTLFGQPYETGITYISAHAQKGMFAPLLAASERNDGAELLGMPVSVYTDDGHRFDYEVSRVVRHRTDYSIVDEIPLDERTLIMQTSEGVYGTVEKVQVIAMFVSETTVDVAEANPTPKPRDCEPHPSPEPSASSAP
jgi:hypothetical protein